MSSSSWYVVLWLYFMSKLCDSMLNVVLKICMPYTNLRFIATTTTTTTTPIPTTTTSKEEEKEVMKSGVNKELEDIFVKTTTPPRTCKKTFQRHLEWPETELGKMARVKCPAGMKGHAEWNCSEFGEWTPKTGADLSRCVSDWTEKLLKDVTEEQELLIQLEALKDIHSQSRRHTLVGGELIMIKAIVEKVVENYINIMKSAGSSADERKTGYKMNKVGLIFKVLVNFIFSSGLNLLITCWEIIKEEHGLIFIPISREKLQIRLLFHQRNYYLQSSR